MRVLIKSAECRDQIARKTGTHWFFQSAALETSPNEFPRPFEIIHEDPKQAYQPGAYEFAPDAIYVATSGADAGRLKVSPRLVPIKKVGA